MLTEDIIPTLRINPFKEGAFSIVSYACDLSRDIGFTDVKKHKVILEIIHSDSYDSMLGILEENFGEIVKIQMIISS